MENIYRVFVGKNLMLTRKTLKGAIRAAKKVGLLNYTIIDSNNLTTVISRGKSSL